MHQSCKETIPLVMLSRAGDLPRIPAPLWRVSPRHLLPQAKALPLRTGTSSPSWCSTQMRSSNFTNKLQGEEAAAARAACNHHCRKQHGQGPEATAQPR